MSYLHTYKISREKQIFFDKIMTVFVPEFKSLIIFISPSYFDDVFAKKNFINQYRFHRVSLFTARQLKMPVQGMIK